MLNHQTGIVLRQFALALFCVTLVTACGEPPSVPPRTGESVDDLSDKNPGNGGPKADGFEQEAKQCGPFPSYYFQFLDDTQCIKQVPADRDRGFVCPVQASSASVNAPSGDGLLHYEPASAAPSVDDEALKGIVPDDMRITLVLVRRVNGVPHYRYLSNGTHAETFQPWSTTKFMAIANAGATLRKESNGWVGLTAEVDGQPIGDLVTVVHNYDEETHTSNGLARWFLNIGTRAQLDRFIHEDWLGRPNTETLGGNYGHPAAKIGTSFNDTDASLEVPGEETRGPNNHLSTYTIAEFLKRLVMHREDPELAMPYLRWPDVETLLYGAEDSKLYGPEDPQGMESDTAVYLQNAVDAASLDGSTQGRWRVFSKLGFGYSRGGEFVNAGYACIPVFDEKGHIKTDWGKEFFIVTQMGANEQYHQSDSKLAQIYKDVVTAIRSGRIK